jgi:hypothetical protein
MTGNMQPALHCVLTIPAQPAQPVCLTCALPPSLLEQEAQAAGASGQQAWAAALVEGVAAIQKYGGAEPGSRSMLDALLPASSALDAALSQGGVVRLCRITSCTVARACFVTHILEVGVGASSKPCHDRCFSHMAHMLPCRACSGSKGCSRCGCCRCCINPRHGCWRREGKLRACRHPV